jgi:hypothetical protein
MVEINFPSASRVQLTSDGHKHYLEAIEGAFGGDIDYAMLVMFTARPRKVSAVTARPSAPERTSIASKAIPIRNMSALRL